MFDFIGPAEPVALSKAPLALVVVQIKFASRSTLGSHQGAQALHDLLSDRYPRFLSEQTAVVTASPDGLTTSTVPQWRFTDLKSEWSCVVGAEAIALETPKYPGWIEFRRRLTDVVEALDKIASPKVRERVGLRYVNVIEPDPKSGLAKRVRPEFLGIAGMQDWSSAIRVAATQVVLQDGETIAAIRSGLGIAAQPPLPTGSFLLDLDLYCETPAEFEAAPLLDYLDGLNDSAHRIFCEAVTEDYRSTLV